MSTLASSGRPLLLISVHHLQHQASRKASFLALRGEIGPRVVPEHKGDNVWITAVGDSHMRAARCRDTCCAEFGLHSAASELPVAIAFGLQAGSNSADAPQE